MRGPGVGAPGVPVASVLAASPTKTSATLDAHDLMAMMQENTKAMLESSRLMAKEEREALMESRRESSPAGYRDHRGGSGIAGLEFQQNPQF